MNSEEKFNKMKDLYSKLRDEHVKLLKQVIHPFQEILLIFGIEWYPQLSLIRLSEVKLIVRASPFIFVGFHTEKGKIFLECIWYF